MKYCISVGGGETRDHNHVVAYAVMVLEVVARTKNLRI